MKKKLGAIFILNKNDIFIIDIICSTINVTIWNEMEKYYMFFIRSTNSKIIEYKITNYYEKNEYFQQHKMETLD